MKLFFNKNLLIIDKNKDGVELFFRELGKGQPVVILHGLFGISDNWITLGRRLSETHKVFLVDMRNHGQSPHSDQFDYRSLIEDVQEFLVNHQLRDVVLMGHSLGGKTAMGVALLYPQSLEKLVVVDISMRKYAGDRDHQQLIDAMMKVDFSRCKSRSDVEKQLLEEVPSVKLRQFLMKNVYWKDKERMDWRLNLRAINAQLPNVFEGVEPSGRYLGPTLFVRGEKSDYLLDQDVPELSVHFPNGELVTIPDASHWVHADQPEMFYSVVSHFLAR